MTWPRMEAALQQAIDSNTGRVGVAVHSPHTGESLVMGDTGQIRTASTNKIPALVLLLEQAATGVVDLNESVYVTVDDYPSGGSDMYSQGLLPGWFTVADLAHRMIVASDNTATNVIMSLVGRQNIRDMLTGLGIDPAMVQPDAYTGTEDGQRWVTDHWEYTMDAWATTSVCRADDLMRLLTIIHEGAQSSVVYQHAIAIMLQTRDKSRLRGGLPALTPLAHKAGSLSGENIVVPPTWSGFTPVPGISNDAGILQVSGREYVVAVMTEGDTLAGSATIRQISAIIFDGLVGGRGADPVTAIYADHGRTQLA